jgi:hypothetical protein
LKAERGEKMAKRNINALLVLAGLFIGIGVGLALDKTGAGTLVGLGVGFLAAFIAAKIEKKK